MSAMRFLMVVAVALLAVIVAIPWIMSNIDDSAFRQDIALVPGLVGGPSGVIHAKAVADVVVVRAKERGIVLKPDTLKVEVSEGRTGSYQVASGALTVVGHNVRSVQDVVITTSYDRPLLSFFKRHIDVRVDTTGPGAGPASSYPPH